MAFTIKVNGNMHSVDVDGDTPLLWVLRDVLGMTGTKFGCGMALCGACTVHIDGAPTRSCITPIERIGNSEITTIEVIGDGRVQQTNFDTYQMLRINDAPAIEVHIVESTESPGGKGEAGTSAIVPAIANAIFAATGKRLRKMPVDSAALKLPT